MSIAHGYQRAFRWFFAMGQDARFGTFADAREIARDALSRRMLYPQQWGIMSRRQYEEDSLVFRVGMRIRKLRMEQGISLRNFGKRSGVHPFHVMAIELGQLAANTKTLRSIANALGVTSLDLLNHDTHNDDMGHLVELMRKEPDYVQKIRHRIEPLGEN